MMMNNYQKLNDIKKEVICNFKEDELKVYISQLTNRYYSSFLNDDFASHNNVNTELKNVIDLCENRYPNIENYIMFSLLNSANNLFQKSFQRDISLKCPIDIDINADKSDVTINLLERVKEKRKELNNLHKGDCID